MLMTCIAPSPCVIVVDDDPDLTGALRFHLELEGRTVRCFSSAAALLKEEALPDRGCLVLDYHLPGMTGLELLGRLREAGVTLPAIMITTDQGDGLRERIAA
ncbi:MAG: response regulator, partial [Alphaproteobacteria bacterium]|nr:response regulator [Alphaproteobacteria bacterium]